MNAIATRLQGLQVTTAAVAVAAAATLVPVAAQAAPEISLPTAPVTQVLDNLSLGPEGLTVGCNSWFFCFGPTNPAPNPNLVVALTLGLPLLGPLIVTPLLTALGLNNTTICLGGFGLASSTYGHITTSFSLGCA
jgi:hypothetical protein